MDGVAGRMSDRHRVRRFGGPLRRARTAARRGTGAHRTGMRATRRSRHRRRHGGRALARRDPVGQWLRIGKSGGCEVVGVAADVRRCISAGTRSYLSAAAGQRVRRAGRGHRADGGRSAFAQSFGTRSAHSIRVAGGRQHHAGTDELPQWPARTAAGFLTVCGTLALLLATVGLFGVTYYTVSQRTREFGVRVALGATPGERHGPRVGEGLMLSLPGVASGIAGALLAVRLISDFLVGVGPADPATYLAAGRCRPPSRSPPASCRRCARCAPIRCARCGRSRSLPVSSQLISA